MRLVGRPIDNPTFDIDWRSRPGRRSNTISHISRGRARNIVSGRGMVEKKIRRYSGDGGRPCFPTLAHPPYGQSYTSPSIVCRYDFHLFDINILPRQPNVRGGMCVGEQKNKPTILARFNLQSRRYQLFAKKKKLAPPPGRAYDPCHFNAKLINVSSLSAQSVGGSQVSNVICDAPPRPQP
jgi:hypothetical protein